MFASLNTFRARRTLARISIATVCVGLLLVNALARQSPPPPTAPQAIPALEYRAWTSAAGDTIEAAFINLHQGQVVLQSREQQQIAIPMHRLVWQDQVAARRLAGIAVNIPALANTRTAPQGTQEFEGRVIAAFGPECQALLTAAIADAQKEILIAIYTLTNTQITDALLEAATRDVKIHIKYDDGQIETGRMRDLITALRRHRNITVTPITMRGRFASMHHKFAVLDQSVVFTGSFNFTVTAATVSYENAVLIESDGLAERFLQEFEAIESR